MTPELRAKLAGRRVVASVSGGKDSAAMSLWLAENDIEHCRVFMDTGWEHPATYEYLRGPLTKKLGSIEEIRSEKFPGGMVDLVMHKGVFPTGTRRFCTDELKRKPLTAYVERLQDSGIEVLNCVGIRAEESEARAQNPEWEWSDWLDCEVWRPILRWTEQEVIDIHTRHGLAPNPLYTRGGGVRRVGCWPCIYARKDEIRFLAEIDPERVAQIRKLEADVSAVARGKKLKILNQTWFRSEQLSVGFPIDDAVRWSRTSRGGKQYEMFADSGREGCMRWGLCDTAPEAA